MKKTFHLLEPRPLPRLLSVVIAVFNEEEALPFLRERLTSWAGNFSFQTEFVFVNDGSEDRSLEVLIDWAQADSRVTVLNLARNFGHQSAVTAGLDHAAGDAVVIMDADLQDPPEVVSAMLEQYCKGFDVVYGRRVSREGESSFKRFTAWAFYRAMQMLTHEELPKDVGDFRLMSRACLKAVLSMREPHRFLRGMVAWVGFPQTAVEYARASRVAGETKYPLRKMVLLAWTATVSFSPVPLRLSFVIGLLIAGIGMLEAVNAVVRTLLGMYVVPGWTSMIIVTCLIGGANLIGVGVLGEYVGRIFESSKQRPLYLVASTVNRKEKIANTAVDEGDPVPEQLALLSGGVHEG